MDTAGDIVVADTANNWIGFLANQSATIDGISMTANSIYAVGAGTACATITGACGDTGAATSASFSSPSGAAVASAGTVYVADKGTDRLRELIAAPALFDLPSTVTFPNYVLAGVNGSSIGALSIDLLPSTYSVSSQPWSITITSTTFTSGSHSLSTSATTVGAPIDSCDAAFACVAVSPRSGDPTYPFTVPAAATAPAAATFFSDQTGTGPQTLSFDFAVALPANAFAGTYTSTWTITDQSGP